MKTMVGQKTFDTILGWYRFGVWVISKHPELIIEYFTRHVENVCPKCGNELDLVHFIPQYWMCFKCIKGYNNEELKKEG